MKVDLSTHLKKVSCYAGSFLKGYVADCMYYIYAREGNTHISLVAKTLILPLLITFHLAAVILDKISMLFSSEKYQKLDGKSVDMLEEISIYSCNVSMLDYGISALDGLSRPKERISDIAGKILSSKASFVCLQELSFANALVLWDQIKHEYNQGYTRIIDSMPYSLMDTGLFVASKASFDQVLYFPLPYKGGIPRAVVALRHTDYWMLNTHFSLNPEERKKQFHELIHICHQLYLQRNLPCFVCMDGNIERTADAADEFNLLGFPQFFLLPESESTFSLSLDSATAVDSFLYPHPKAVHIDYVLCYLPSAQQIRFSNQLDRYFSYQEGSKRLSDHHAIITKISTATK
ncbi:MAG: hypothetical protein EBZ47_06040 [Chlamydiae bacterium]|nr:hypothetical protein [Chlamydiota bacterium]